MSINNIQVISKYYIFERAINFYGKPNSLLRQKKIDKN
jgi:hypothetical protein